MIESILNSVKKTAAGLTEDDDSFDDDIIIFINNAFFKLKQLGVFETPYTITGATETWSDCLGERAAKLASVPAYVSQYVKMTFDPNQNGTLQNSLKEELKEMEQRFIYECDPDYDDGEVVSDNDKPDPISIMNSRIENDPYYDIYDDYP